MHGGRRKIFFLKKSFFQLAHFSFIAYLNPTEEKEGHLKKLNVVENVLKTPIKYMHMLLMSKKILILTYPQSVIVIFPFLLTFFVSNSL